MVGSGRVGRRAVVRFWCHHLGPVFAELRSPPEVILWRFDGICGDESVDDQAGQRIEENFFDGRFTPKQQPTGNGCRSQENGQNQRLLYSAE